MLLLMACITVKSADVVRPVMTITRSGLNYLGSGQPVVNDMVAHD
jgi:hypothetical protein